MRSWRESKPGWLVDRLSWHYLRRKLSWAAWSVRGRWIDFRLGGSTYANQPTRFRHLGSTIVQTLDYENLSAVMDLVRVDPDDVLVDVGCATGRVLNWWLASGLKNRLIGIELDPEIAARTRKRLASHRNVEVIAGDAVALTPNDATLCFLYNPFKGDVLQRWLDGIVERSTSRRLRVVYVNPKFLDVFERNGTWSIAHASIPWHDVAICELASSPGRPEISASAAGEPSRC